MRRRLLILGMLLAFINVAAAPFAQLNSIRRAAGGDSTSQPYVRGTIFEMIADLLFDETGDAQDISGPLDEESGAKSGNLSETKVYLHHQFSLQILGQRHSTSASAHVENALLEPDRDRFVPPPRPDHTTIS